MGEQQARVFVSHHHSPMEDAFTARLVADLEAAGADVWVDTTGITSDDFVRRISEGLARRQWLVLVMTPDAVQSPWVQREVNAALAEQTSGRMLGVLPVEMLPCDVHDLPLLWRTLHRIDATRDYPSARARLLQALGLLASAGAYAPTPSGFSSTPTSRPTSVPTPAAQIHIQEFPVPLQKSGPDTIVSGPDGALWFSECAEYRIGRITLSGQIQEYPIPGRGKGLDSIMPVGIVGLTTGADGAFWFTNYDANEIGRLTTSGEVTRYSLSNHNITNPKSVASGPDGALWFGAVNHLVRMTTDWQLRAYGLPGFLDCGTPGGITSGPDSMIWFTNPRKHYIGRMGADDKVQQFPLADKNSQPSLIVAGPDGALWFTQTVNRIGRLTLSGQVHEYPLPSAESYAGDITVGPDGALWFTEPTANCIGRMTMDGQVQEYPLPSPGSTPSGITVGPDGAIWFTEFSGKRIGRITW